MDFDWITLYDYMSIFSRSEIKSKINKFYQSFYPLKLKKANRQQFSITKIQRGGFMGIIATYIQKMLFALRIYIQAQFFLSQGKIKQQLKLSRMFVQIQTQNLLTSLRLQKTVYVITEAYKIYSNKQDQKTSVMQKGFLQIKLLCSLNRLFQFIYSIYGMKNQLDQQGFQMLFKNLKSSTIQACQKSMNHIKLYPQMGQVMSQILSFFSASQKVAFNFHAHLMEQTYNKKRTFPLRVKKLLAVIPNKQKSLFVNLGDQNFLQVLSQANINITKDPIQNYFRSEEQINGIVAEQQNFIESILVPQKYRGKPQWKKKVTQQLVNLSIQKQMENKSKLSQSKAFRMSQDYPLHTY